MDSLNVLQLRKLGSTHTQVAWHGCPPATHILSCVCTLISEQLPLPVLFLLAGCHVRPRGAKAVRVQLSRSSGSEGTGNLVPPALTVFLRGECQQTQKIPPLRRLLLLRGDQPRLPALSGHGHAIKHSQIKATCPQVNHGIVRFIRDPAGSFKVPP